ncbi:MAG: DUF4149 domain-containing protein [Deltaproteobacteria bacterium]|nr:DUF4149 domain-containing protein [Deltaproteobacteria bacterium]
MTLLLALDLIVVASTLLYAGAIGALGAIVAPVVFRSGISSAADLMTTIFGRFDRVAGALALVALLAEFAALMRRRSETTGSKQSRLNHVRSALVAVFSLTVAIQAAVLSPGIAALHREGVQRGVGPRGATFDRMHRASSSVGKLAVLSALAIAALALKNRSRDPGVS